MKVKYICIAIVLLLMSMLNAGVITENTAREVAFKWWQFACPDQPSFDASEVIPIGKDGQILYYVLNTRSGGFVLVAGTDASVPILGYSTHGKFSYPVTSPEVVSWVEQTEAQLLRIQNDRLPNTQTQQQWDDILGGNFSRWESTRSVEPLLNTNWDQGTPYNVLCPVDAASPAGGYAWAGCGAAAMAQVMRYWSYPPQGTGSRTYTSPPYGQVSANFGQTNYNWDNMPATCPTGNLDIARLMYHCAIALYTQFGPSVSTFQTINMTSAFSQYFGYQMPTYRNRISYSESEWNSMILENLAQLKPIIYFSAHTGISHLYVLDGYQNTDYFHINWCWSGQYNGYYYLNNLNPGGVDYSNGQGGIFDIEPLVQVPVRPSNLTSEFVSNYLINLDWDDIANNETGFRIERKIGATGSWTFLANVGSNVINYSDTALESFTTYYYRVRAYNASGISSWSNEVYSITGGVIAPVQAMAVLSGTNIPTVTWSANPNAVLYRVFGADLPYSYGNPAWTLLGETAGTSITLETSARHRFYYMTALSAFEVPQNFVLVQGGTFNNGTSNVTLSSFYIDKYEVTQDSYLYVMGSNPSNFTGNPSRPVEKSTWFKAVEYCNRRSILEGLTPCYSYGTSGTNPDNWPSGWNSVNENHINISCNWSAFGYRLPTEMEWLFAARGGTLTHNYTYSGGNDLGPIAWYFDNAGNATHEVGTKAANELALHDMNGNVFEWVWDIFGAYPGGAQTNPRGATTGTNRCRRGGAFGSTASALILTYRSSTGATSSLSNLGFRVVRIAP